MYTPCINSKIWQILLEIFFFLLFSSSFTLSHSTYHDLTHSGIDVPASTPSQHTFSVSQCGHAPSFLYKTLGS